MNMSSQVWFDIYCLAIQVGHLVVAFRTRPLRLRVTHCREPGPPDRLGVTDRRSPALGWPQQASQCQKEAVYKVLLDASVCTSLHER